MRRALRLKDEPPSPKSAIAVSLRPRPNAVVERGIEQHSLLCLHQGAPLPSSSTASRSISRSCLCGWCPQPGYERQDFLEHLSRHRDLGQLSTHDILDKIAEG